MENQAAQKPITHEIMNILGEVGEPMTRADIAGALAMRGYKYTDSQLSMGIVKQQGMHKIEMQLQNGDRFYSLPGQHKVIDMHQHREKLESLFGGNVSTINNAPIVKPALPKPKRKMSFRDVKEQVALASTPITKEQIYTSLNGSLSLDDISKAVNNGLKNETFDVSKIGGKVYIGLHGRDYGTWEQEQYAKLAGVELAPVQEAPVTETPIQTLQTPNEQITVIDFTSTPEEHAEYHIDSKGNFHVKRGNQHFLFYGDETLDMLKFLERVKPILQDAQDDRQITKMLEQEDDKQD